MAKFDMNKIPQDELVAFYGLSFAASAADGHASKEEMVAIFGSLDLEALDEAHRKQVQGFVLSPPDLDSCLDQLVNACDELRYAVIVAVVETILADDIMEEEEKEFLASACTRLRVTEDQQKAIINFVKEARRVAREGLDNNAAEKAIKSAAAGLVAVGVPIAAVYFSGTIIGLSAAGITGGLAALGFGFGMVPGIGVAVVLGTAVFLGTKWLLGDSREVKEEKLRAAQERKAQLVIKNLQEAITRIIDRIESLEAAAAQSAANREAISDLTERLNSLKQVLRQREARGTA